jgi:para-aminobenzoate synthetase component 1
MITSTLASKLDFLPDKSDTLLSSPLQTEISFLDIAARFAHMPGTVVLTSGGNPDCARYNILAVDPWLTLKTTLTCATIESVGHVKSFEADPFDVLKYLVSKYKLPDGDYPFPICAGLFGYLSYDLKDCIEELPRTSVDDLHLPHLYMIAPSIIVIEDLYEKKMTIHVSTIGADATEHRASFDHQLINYEPTLSPKNSDNYSSMKSLFTREEYLRSIEAIRDYIIRGHVYQVNMSQRFESNFDGNAFELFSSLFKVNPAPFYAYINADDHHIVSTSPERFIELRGKQVETRPIKGTRPRGKTPDEDMKLRDDLVNSPKDDAELSMIVDLLRNDIGKVCCAGSVKVREHKRLETYQNVFHLVSIIDGVLDDDKDIVDLIRATFPGGSITGCPKIRAMEIIDELEPVRRHIYTGSIGYISFHDSMDLSIAIRTATIKGSRLVFSVGGGIVFDSDPNDEYEETLHKGRTLMNAFSGKSVSITEPSPVAWCNGKFMTLEDITVSVNGEGFLYGYGIFETIRVQNGKPCRLSQHLNRFENSWKFCFDIEPPDITWDAVIGQVLDRCGLSKGISAVKLLAAAGEPGKPESMTFLVTARPYIHRLKTTGRDGLYLASYPYQRYSSLALHKTMNYMFCKMANGWAKKQGADEALIVNTDGSVCETATANILCIIDGKWYRPQSGYVLPGIMQKAVCDLLFQRGITVEELVLSVDELKKADQVFLTNALMGLVPVFRIDNITINGDTSKELCEEINSVLFL